MGGFAVVELLEQSHSTVNFFANSHAVLANIKGLERFQDNILNISVFVIFLSLQKKLVQLNQLF